MMTERKQHWENVYETKDDQEVSWYQEIPVTSLKLIDSLNLKKDDAIIDVGGGNSNLVVELSKKGFKNLSVLDISAKSLERTKLKLKQTVENRNKNPHRTTRVLPWALLLRYMIICVCCLPVLAHQSVQSMMLP